MAKNNNKTKKAKRRRSSSRHSRCCPVCKRKIRTKIKCGKYIFCSIECRHKFLVKLRSALEYKKFRQAVLARDRYKCTKCGSTDKLCVHHIKEVRKHPELVYDTNNGVTLCTKCHNKIHTKLIAKILKMRSKKRKGKKK